MLLGNVQRNFTKVQRHCQGKGCYFSMTPGGGMLCAKNASANRQAKVINKLFGERRAGNKKRWYPSGDSSNATFFNVSQFASTTKINKNTTRRMAVLNKLFMTHITDLLATGETSEAILGRGLQVTRVKISPDFACINVYWLGSGDASNDALLEKELRRCSGLLHHELSQLMLISKVPHVQFAREKRNINIAQVDTLLANMDFSDTNVEDAETDTKRKSEQTTQIYSSVAHMIRREFYEGDIKQSQEESQVTNENDEFPVMRHDVLGLDHQLIMSKIMLKMRKSKLAWQQHNQRQNNGKLNTYEADTASATNENIMSEVNQKLADAKEKEEKFLRFLAKRKEHKNIPERKKHERASEWTENHAVHGATDAAVEATISPLQRRLMEAEDFLHEDDDSNLPKPS